MTEQKVDWEPVIGLETHVQLGTNSKIFTSASTSFGDDPNTHIDPIVCGLPGTLPVLNKKVLEFAVKASMALNLKIAKHCKFDRKQYFYPDLPKNYQISQFDEPIAEEGWIEVEVAEKGKETYLKKIGIERLHMEEDAGKLVHAGSDRLSGSKYSLVDYNRAGVALAEIVSKPDLRSGREASEYASEIRRIVRYLGVSDGNMQEGSLRCDVNISVRRGPNAPFGTKVEIKNMNSFSAIQKACEYEIKRQISTYESGGIVHQETRLWDETKQLTKSMRSKEGSSDYRYFPDPDLGPIEVSVELQEKWRSELPELPSSKRHRYAEELGLSVYDARVLTDDYQMARYFEIVVLEGADPKLASNWITGDIAAHINANKKSFENLLLTPKQLAEMLLLISQGKISGKIAKEILPELLEKGGSPKELVEERGLGMISDPKVLGAIVDQLLSDYPNEVESYRGGKNKLQGFFVGQLMKKTSGKADPKLGNQILTKKLKGE
ncbi:MULTISPECIES: Asp-tRNA(Asn)/Glu-tRNA(Gln) amidotransferase subunit GatB [Prochlorococcus]|uniref:Aspartyl/glutamyl-tRNA(Asn/Gln) amidotransferase subunit B n=1 Tax=Prochlorococcus marinus (strain SARG / CCMP1375 / SS120) TaxID=167539 RepID=GATB_PROMA|nr:MULTISPECIES: Asp-tRNA(Asn)/Glu-tRNA(Gln) amidotransferase subunit GatB [Prochlorococcus]Q7VEG1.1 RecName: Full=Aspartyl/glutamyl-tRNA(Asn/Gln) amidotransferase subunit B; Short=Asp/Glu-ADT subunit B [Prochlorococcus marinus subsp. marinus str. CCMP1375]AAP99098.1 Asp-tRNAAsn/Glu-tRNAGln amidotransferase B subunit [Prochlorococcus marinus subsp. marinus str. CCMP1375]KGG11643.1 Aspartyl-tRNA(Asn) amidotransferase subunit B Glutamyl-tRNA(Gln) amidotransferase subunit B [Prochlorococcus marinus